MTASQVSDPTFTGTLSASYCILPRFMDRNDIIKYYATGIERNRLNTPLFQLEGERSKHIISRFLTDKPMAILDVGGGAGFYAYWLTSIGHHVTLVDLSPENIRFAREIGIENECTLAGYEIGDAISLSFPDDSFDMVLLMGPLYHLVNKQERIKALSEARRVSKRGGIVCAAVISRYASLIDGLTRNLVNDEAFFEILIRDLETGTHVNSTGNPEYFTTAFFHTPQEIRSEMNEAGWKMKAVVAVEGIGWMVTDIENKEKDQAVKTRIEILIKKLEANEDLLCMSPHLIAVGEKT